MKKMLLTVMTALLLILPFDTVALAEHQEASAAPASDYVPGAVPAETGAAESMTPALHAVILSMVNHSAPVFDPQDELVAWEALYNMLSLYGQLDDRSEYLDEALVLPSETVLDYAAALLPGAADLCALPEALSDRITYNPNSDSYLLACGDDDLADLTLDSIVRADGGLRVTGSLVYLVDGTNLASFQAILTPRDSMLGYTISSLELL